MQLGALVKEKVPAGQLVQDAALAAENVPACGEVGSGEKGEQSKGGKTRRCEHGRLCAAGAAEVLPFSVESPRALTAQAVQVDEPAVAAEPAAQATHWLGSVAPELERAVPAGQSVQLEAPWLEYDPGKHEEQVAAAADAKEPAAHIEHPLALVVPLLATVPL